MTISRRSDCWLSRDEGRSWTRQLEAAPWGARSGMGMVALPSGALVLAGGGVGGTNKWFSDCFADCWLSRSSWKISSSPISPPSVRSFFECSQAI